MNKANQSIEIYRRLLPISKKLRKSFENDCNYGETKRRENLQAKLISEAREIANIFCVDADIYVQQDPRGCALYVIPRTMPKPDENYSKGIAIY